MSPSRRTVLIMMIQSFGVTGAVIAKQVTEAVLPVRVGDQTVSIVMPYFMTEMSEQRAIASCICTRTFSRMESSASSTLRMIKPLA